MAPFGVFSSWLLKLHQPDFSTVAEDESPDAPVAPTGRAASATIPAAIATHTWPRPTERPLPTEVTDRYSSTRPPSAPPVYPKTPSTRSLRSVDFPGATRTKEGGQIAGPLLLLGQSELARHLSCILDPLDRTEDADRRRH